TVTSGTPSPDNHLVAGPHCRVKESAKRGVGAGRCPTVGGGIIFPAGIRRTRSISAPYNHFTASPNRRVRVSAIGGIGDTGRCPTICAGIVLPSAAAITTDALPISAPDDHFAAGPHCRVLGSRSGGVGGVGCCPRVTGAWRRRRR